MRERDVEAAVCMFAKTLGVIPLKLASANNRGQPDRAFFFSGRTLFLEFKAPGCRPTDLQIRWLKRLTEAGFKATWVDSIPEGKRLIHDLVQDT